MHNEPTTIVHKPFKSNWLTSMKRIELWIDSSFFAKLLYFTINEFSICVNTGNLLLISFNNLLLLITETTPVPFRVSSLFNFYCPIFIVDHLIIWFHSSQSYIVWSSECGSRRMVICEHLLCKDWVTVLNRIRYVVHANRALVRYIQ